MYPWDFNKTSFYQLLRITERGNSQRAQARRQISIKENPVSFYTVTFQHSKNMRQDDIYLRMSTFMFTSCPLILSLKSYIYFKVHVLTGKDDRTISWWFHGWRWKLAILRRTPILAILKSISSSHYFDTIHKTLNKN